MNLFLNALDAYTRRHRRIPETQYGGRQTGYCYNSCSTTDRIEIPNATHIFSGSPFSMDSLPTSADNHPIPETQDGGTKPEVVVTRVPEQIESKL
jgi:hypothetical protein